MGAFESKRWHELTPETPQKEKNRAAQEEILDPRSPLMHQQRTPIVLQEYEESPQNIVLRAEFSDPRSPTVKFTRTPLTVGSKAVLIVDEKDDDVFEGRERSTSDPQSPTPHSKAMDESEVNSLGAPLIKKDKVLLKNTASPGDLKRKNRLRRRQSLPQKLFSENKFATFPRSPLAQRNNSLPDNQFRNGKNKKFTLLSKKKSFIGEDFNDDKENTNMPVIH